MSKGFPNRSSASAELGTAAHELGEFCLKVGCNAYDCIGLTFNEHKVDAEMAEAVQLYVGYIRVICSKNNVNPMLEKRVIMSSVGSDVFGTADCIIIVGRLLIVLDYKHGFQVVEVKNNSQAIFYAIATLDTMGLWESIDTIDTYIIQPRADHIDGAIRSHSYTLDELVLWQHRFTKAVELARRNDNSTIASDDCHFCPARAMCRARMQRTVDKAGLDKPLLSLTKEELIVVFRESASIMAHLKAVNERIIEIAREGKQIKDFKLVKAISRAKCIDVDGFIAAAKAAKPELADDQIFTRQPLGMTKMKKLLPAKLVNQFFEKPPASTTLVDIRNSRPAISTGSAKGVFEPINPVKTPSCSGVFENLNK